jgi:hypothetical protein
MLLAAFTSFSEHSSREAKLSVHHSPIQEEDDMERRDFLKIALGAVGGAAALAATARAAPLSPHQIVEDGRLSATQDAQPAVTNENEVDRVSPEEVYWRHRHWRRWHRRHWRRWHRRHWRRW